MSVAASKSARQPSESATASHTTATELRLSQSQRLIWLGQELMPNVPQYEMSYLFTISGVIDRDVFRNAFRRLVQDTPILRQIAPGAGSSAARILESCPSECGLEDLSRSDDPAASLREFVTSRMADCLQLSEALYESTLLQLAPAQFCWFVKIHHSITDAFNGRVLLASLSEYYLESAANTPRVPRCSFAEYIESESAVQAASDFADHQQWWAQRSHERHQSRFYRATAAADCPYQKRLTVALDDAQTARLLKLAEQPPFRQFSATLSQFNIFAVALTAWLHRMENLSNICIGATSHGRVTQEFRETIGLFMQLLPVQVEIGADESFQSLSEKLALETGGFLRHAVPGVAEPETQHSFDVALNVINLQVEPFAGLPATLEWLHNGRGDPRRRLTISVHQRAGDGRLELIFDFNCAAFNDEDMSRAIAHYCSVLEEMTNRPAAKLNEFRFLTPADDAFLSEHLGALRELVPGNVWSRFAERAEFSPQEAAIRDEAGELSYSELRQQALNLATTLSESECGQIVPLLCDRNAHAVIGMLGILAAGRCFMPVDRNLPAARIHELLDDSGAQHYVDPRQQPVLLSRPSNQPTSAAATADELAENACYLLYTSGSTGRPNGVVVGHESLLNLLDDFEQIAPPGPGPCSWWTNVGFDVAIYEVFSALLFGHTLCIPPEHVRNSAGDLFLWLADQRIASAYLPPFFLSEFAAFVGAHSGIALQRLLVGVEPIPQRLLAAIATQLPDLNLINGYGPTEATVCATLRLIERDDRSDQPASIGRPVTGNVLQIVDAWNNPVPPGVPGELLIGGAGVARGYLRRPQLTAARFVSDPRQKSPPVWYRTGDRVRLREDGCLQFLGRMDDQVKIRGHRIEPAEIVAVMRNSPAVRDCAVVCLHGDQKSELTAFVDSDHAIDITDLRAHLLSRLPRYMVPSRIIPVDALPRTANGKPDHAALRQLAEDQRRTEPQQTTAPRSPLEFTLVSIWQETLGVSDIGIRDNFFTVGGDSLNAVRFVARAEQLGIHLAVHDLFVHPTVAELAAVVQPQAARENNSDDSQWNSGQPQSKSRGIVEVPLTPVQRGIWYLAQTDTDSAAYHLQIRAHVSGQLNQDIATACFSDLVRRHEALRTTFAAVSGRPVSMVRPSSDTPITWRDLTTDGGLDQHAAVLHQEGLKPFDLNSGPLIRLLVINLADGECHLAITAHHIAVDQQSISILLEEFAQLYADRCRGGNGALPELQAQFADFAVLQREPQPGAEAQKNLAYWIEQLRDCATQIHLPRDRPGGRQRSSAGACHRFSLTDDVSEKLRDLARGSGVSLNVLLMAAFRTLLYRYSGESNFILGVPVSKRPQHRFERTVGCFIESLPLPCPVTGTDRFEQVVTRTRQCFADALEHLDVSFDDVVRGINPPRSWAANPLFQTMFVLQQPLQKLRPTDSLTLEPHVADLKTSKFDLTMFVSDESPALKCLIEYSTDLFNRSTIARLAKHWQTLLASIVADPQSRVNDIEILAPNEHVTVAAHTVTAAASQSVPEQNTSQCIHDLFEQQVRACPSAPALICEDQVLTYEQLNDRAEQLASQLVRQGVRPEQTVALCCERTPDMIIGILGILKAGGAYVPLDPHQPSSRLRQLITSVGAVAVVSEVAATSEPASASSQVVTKSAATAQSLAYVMFTSGSTGQPRGVEVTHDALVRSTRARFGFYEDAPERFLLLSSVWFDSSVAGIFWTLCSGGTLVVPPESHQHDIRALAAAIGRHGVTHTLCLPSVYQLLLRHADEGQLSTLRNVVVAGESCSRAVVTQHFRRLPNTRLFNEYGPTEASVWATVHEIPDADTDSLIPIGKSVGDVVVRVLDENLRPVPVGVRGEIYIGGPRLARAYRNQPDLTAERFVPDLCSSSPENRMYRTGDLARLREDGSLLFLGRTDDQLKVNGQRIEPAEIEAVLSCCPGVNEVVVGPARVSRTTSGHEVEDLLQRVRTLPADLVDALISEAERQPKGQLPLPAVPARLSVGISDQDLDLQLELKNDRFIATPRERQRKWLVQQVLQESASDLRALNETAGRMVPGSDQPHLPQDLSAARLSEQEIMEDWQTPLMRAMVDYATETHGDILEIGFGRGVSASLIQQAGVRSHTVIEANAFSISDFFQPWIQQFPDRDIRLIEGRWQDVLDQLTTYDGVFFHAFPLNEAEFVQYIANSSTFAEHFFPLAARLLRAGGVFTYLTTEIDSLSRRHQRSLFRHFHEIQMKTIRLSVPAETRDAWWADSMVVLRAIK